MNWKKLFGAALFWCVPLIPAFAASPPPEYGERGMAVAATAEASAAGIAMLKEGGNAIDAAVAMGFVLAVTHPQAGNLGGGGFLVARLANGDCITLDFREMAPSAAHRDMYLDEAGNVIDGLSLNTHMAAGVPGAVDGLLRILADHGSGEVSRADVMAPAIRLAEDGFAITRFFAAELNGARGMFLGDDGAAAVFVKEGGWDAGDVLVQRDLAHTLKRIAQWGRDGFYEGETADLLVAEMGRGNGIITHTDLANYESKYRDPVRGRFRGLEIVSMGPPSSGGVLIVHMLNMLDVLPLDEQGWNSAGYVHLLTEVERRAYADRAEHLGDPDFWDVPVERLMSPEYAKQRAATIDLERATPSDEVKAGTADGAESWDTTHYSVADDLGNAVAVTTTLNTGFGSGLLVDGAGFLLNNEMDDFAAKPGVPNVYGLIGDEANAIEPGKRPLSSMSPTVALRDGKPFLVVGSPGGAMILTTVMQVILNVAVHGMDIQQAVNAPRVHSQWLPDVLYAEPWAVSDDTRSVLESMGHSIEQHEWRYIGRANCLAIEDDAFYGAADPREEDGAAVGY